MSSKEEFYVGYFEQAPPQLARFVRARLALLLLAVVGCAAALAASQGDFGSGQFEFGSRTTLVGRVSLKPFPSLFVDRAGDSTSQYLLVAPGKFGAEDLVAKYDGRRVELDGTLIHRDGRTMVEIVKDRISPVDDSVVPREAPRWTDPEPRTLVGEIVDSKCYLGVMKPGSTKTHRACATCCLSGGIPPVLLVRDEQGLATYLLLVSEEGEPIGERIVERDLVAEPVRVTGRVQRSGEWFVLRTNPDAIERLGQVDTTGS